jgi:hypothetical protein
MAPQLALQSNEILYFARVKLDSDWEVGSGGLEIVACPTLSIAEIASDPVSQYFMPMLANGISDHVVH